MHVILAQISGFCDGVKRAMRLAMEAADKNGGLQTTGPLVHNGAAVELLSLHGITQPDALTKNIPLLVRAHGVTPAERRQWLEAGHELVDATCAHVARNQRLAGEAAGRGALVLLAGDADHAEVKAVAGCTDGKCIVLGAAEDVREIEGGERREALLLAQTTFNVEEFERIAAAVRERFPACVVRDTICRATHDRQAEARRLAARTEVVVVVGGKNSANTRRLAEAVRGQGKPAFLVENADELNPADFAGYSVAGVTSGASTPGWLTQEVVNRLRMMGRDNWRGMAMRMVSPLVQARALSALSALGFALAAQFFLLEELRPALALAGAGYVFFAHTLNRRVPMHPEARRLSVVDRFYRNWRPLLLAGAWAGAGVALVLTAFESLAVWLLFALAVLATSLYAKTSRLAGDGRMAPSQPRNPAMALGWAFTLAGPPALESASRFDGGMAVLWIFLVCLGGTVIRDLHDVASDRLMGIGTLPARWGLRPVRRLGQGVLWMAAAMPLLGLVGEMAHGSGVGVANVFLLLLGLVPAWGLGLLHGLKLRPVQDEVVLQAGVDGMGIVAGLFAVGAWLCL